MAMRHLFTIIFSVLTIQILGQSVPIGQWQDHLTYSNVQLVELANDKAYAASESGLFSVEPDENSLSRLSTINGLSNIKASALGSAGKSAPLFVGYEDGVIDVVSGSNILQVFDVQRSNIIGNKQINHFNFYNENICYISTGFGVLQYDIQRNEIKETFLIGNKGAYIFVNATAVYENQLWAATDSGVYYANLSNDLFDPASWFKDTTLNDSITNYKSIVANGNGLYLSMVLNGFQNDKLYQKAPTGWEQLFADVNEDYFDIHAFEDFLAVANSTSFEVYKNADFVTPNQRLFNFNEKAIFPSAVKYSATGEIWAGTNFQGLLKSRNPFDTDQLLIEGPSSTKAFRLNYSFDEIYVSGGGHSDIQVRTNTPAEVSVFNGSEWTNFNDRTTTALEGLQDILNVSFNPVNQEELAAASMNNGVIIFENDAVKNVYGFENSPLEEQGNTGATFVTGVQYDAEGNLWMSNSLTENPIKVLTAEGAWITYANGDGGGSPVTNQILVTSNNQVWQNRPGAGIYVLGHNGTLNDFSDDDFLVIQEGGGNGALASNDVTAMAEDNDGNVWVGTNVGLTVFYNTADILERNSFDGNEVLIQQDGQTQVLFENQFITDIVVDPANRKWFSTRGAGVYLMSADGTQELAHFTEENSPLYSNNVNSLALLPNTGELFIATEKGIISYRGDATLGNESLENILVFPNPVPPNYNGQIGISGLMDNTEVIISDIGGSVVQRITSNGGQANWNMRNQNGNTVVNGVYLVYVVSEDGTQNNVTKVLIER